MAVLSDCIIKSRDLASNTCIKLNETCGLECLLAMHQSPWVVASFDPILYNGYQSVSWVDYKQRVAKSTAMTTERKQYNEQCMQRRKVVIHNGGDRQFQASTEPFTLEVPLKLTRQGACARRKMKIAVTRQQLGLLLRNSKQFKLKGIAAGFSESFKVGDRKWKPSLVTILKVQKFEKVGIFQLLIHWLRYREYSCVQAWKGQTDIEDDAG
ncbi:hypothetical protein OIU85_000068 [Salix viminalis]|uniref:Uncharacterized protein n=1 Tax=Salix viminalis TaxID=40686 RepID=A0A9Q0ZWC9_SALVM|nr:hypothetical protein OIU85_000068 [Salix viminalis]